MPYNLANLLTLSRIAAIPVLVALLWLPGAQWAWVACGVYALAGLTDYFDGAVARSRKEQSDFGRFLDPIADKLLVASVLLMLTADNRIDGPSVLSALIILCRELLVSGLREYLAGLRVGLPVSRLAKWKTGMQMGAMGFLIVGDHGPEFLPTVLIGDLGLGIAAVITLITGWDYMRTGIGHMRGAPASAPARPASSSGAG